MTPPASLPTTRLCLLVIGALAWLGAPETSSQTFCEQDGRIVMEIESAPLTGDWVEEASLTPFSGTYYRWDGFDLFTTPGVAVLSYTFEVTTPGEYELHIRNYHDDPDSTMENDCWTRLDGSPWLKTFSEVNLQWTWQTRFDPPVGPVVNSTYFLSAGTHTFQISARSNDFRMDKVIFHLPEFVNPICLICPETECGIWTDLGDGLAGTGGLVPELAGAGTLTSAASTTLSLTDALPNSSAFLVLGVAQLGLSFKGGVMVPTVDVLIPGLPTGPIGEIEFSFPWASGAPGGVSLFWQYWIQDAGGPFGFSASNGLESTTPIGP